MFAERRVHGSTSRSYNSVGFLTRLFDAFDPTRDNHVRIFYMGLHVSGSKVFCRIRRCSAKGCGSSFLNRAMSERGHSDPLVTDEPTVRVELRLLSDSNFLAFFQLQRDILAGAVAKDRRRLQDVIYADDDSPLFVCLFNLRERGGL